MRVVLQRSLQASVSIDGKVVGAIDSGLVLLVAIADSDGAKELQWMTEKIANLRVFEDENGKMNRSVLDVNQEILVISQFTLYGNCKKGRRPSFVGAGHPDMAAPMIDRFVEAMKKLGIQKVASGRFGADMKVSLINDGPVTLILDTPDL